MPSSGLLQPTGEYQSDYVGCKLVMSNFPCPQIPPKIDSEPSIKRALVLPMRRCEPQKIIIQVPGNDVTQGNDVMQSDDTDVLDAISLGDPDSDDSKYVTSIMSTFLEKYFVNYF